jgi:hypothetical protein
MKCVDPVCVLPNEYFNVRQETTPKAPIKRLMFCATLVYLITGGTLGGVFYYQLNQTLESRSTQILKAPPETNTWDSVTSDSVTTCSPLGIVSGVTPRRICASMEMESIECSEPDAYFITTPTKLQEIFLGEFMDYLQYGAIRQTLKVEVILGVSVQLSPKGFQIASIELCHELLPTFDEWAFELRCGAHQRDCWLFIDFDRDQVGDQVGHVGRVYAIDYKQQCVGAYEKFYHWEEKTWDLIADCDRGNYNGIIDMMRQTMLYDQNDIVISELAYGKGDDHASYSQMKGGLCENLFFVEQSPFSCETVKYSHPTYLEAASVAYTTAGLVAAVLIPVTAFIAGKMGSKTFSIKPQNFQLSHTDQNVLDTTDITTSQ